LSKVKYIVDCNIELLSLSYYVPFYLLIQFVKKIYIFDTNYTCFFWVCY